MRRLTRSGDLQNAPEALDEINEAIRNAKAVFKKVREWEEQPPRVAPKRTTGRARPLRRSRRS